MKQELCKYFQRGSCKYGERCKYLHVPPQQSKPNAFGFGSQSGHQPQQKNNPFGFGAQSTQFGSQQQQKPNPFGFGAQSTQFGSQQQKSNPFGFGVQSNPQSKGFSDFGSKHSKPFENKWTRSAGGSSSVNQTTNRSQGSDHQCTSPEMCKQIMITDFQEERPVWKLTCYGHFKHLPCDISGDISPEELRAAAYDDAKRGLSAQSIVERERNLLNSKLVEFENLRKNPYSVRANSTIASQNPILGGNPNPSGANQNATPTAFSGFSQMGTSPNTGFGTRPSVQSNNPFGQFNSSSNSGQTSYLFGSNNVSSTVQGSFGSQAPTKPSTIPGSFRNQAPTNPSTIPGSFGSQTPTNPFGNFNTSNVTGFGDKGVNKTESNSPFAAAASFQISSPMGNQSAVSPNGPISSSEPNRSSQVNNTEKKSFTGDVSIWLKEKWTRGEIPEEAPPDELCS